MLIERGVSLAITGASHSRLQGRQVAISRNCDFRYSGIFRKKNPEKSGKSVFWTPGTKIKFWIFWIFSKILYMANISYINPYFRAPSPLKPLKSTPRYQNLPGESVTAHSDHRGPLSDPIYPPKRRCFDLFSPLLIFVRLMWAYLKWS